MQKAHQPRTCICTGVKDNLQLAFDNGSVQCHPSVRGSQRWWPTSGCAARRHIQQRLCQCTVRDEHSGRNPCDIVLAISLHAGVHRYSLAFLYRSYRIGMALGGFAAILHRGAC